jgi:hypothetical protein
MDLAGHEKYLGTTVAGVTKGMSVRQIKTSSKLSSSDEYQCYLIPFMLTYFRHYPNPGLRSHVGESGPPTYCNDNPTYQFVCQHEHPSGCTVDQDGSVSEHLFRDTTQEQGRILKSRDVGLCSFLIRNEEDKDMVQGKMASLVPMIAVPCREGSGLGLLRMLLTKLPQRRQHAKTQRDKQFEYMST